MLSISSAVGRRTKGFRYERRACAMAIGGLLGNEDDGVRRGGSGQVMGRGGRERESERSEGERTDR